MDLNELHGSLDAAIYETVNGFVDPATRSRGATALAPMLGMRPGTLSNKANPQEEHQLTLRESIPLQLVTGDFRILYAYASTLHHVAFALPAHTECGDLELLDHYAALHAELGEVATEVRDTLKDGRVRSTEVQRVREKMHDAMRAGLSFLHRLEALVDDRS